jgi:hypothetical protein
LTSTAVQAARDAEEFISRKSQELGLNYVEVDLCGTAGARAAKWWKAKLF